MRGWIVWVLAALVLTACGQKGGGGGDTRFQLLWPDANGHYRLEEVTIESLASPNELRGEAAEIFSRATFSRSGFNGSLARPHLMKSGDVYIPQDSESMTAVSLYAQFDRLLKFERRLKIEGQVNWPRRVGLETKITNGGEIFRHNNAHYFTNLDVTGVVPFTRDDLVPVAMNLGILAHEHFHAHFQAQVMNVVNHARAQTVVSALENIFNPLMFVDPNAAKFNPRSTRDLNTLVLRAWNEGLADFFAGIYRGQSDFFKSSLPVLAKDRDLDREAGPFFNASTFHKLTEQGLSDDDLASLAYGQGTNLGRLFYLIAHTGSEAPQQLLTRVMNRLGAIAEMAGPLMDSRVMDFEEVVPVLLAGYATDSSTCVELNGALMNSTMKRSFSQCGF